MDRGEIIIRSPIAADAEAIAFLSEQLGYPVTPVAMQNRLTRIQQDGDRHAIYVAVRSPDRIVGWIHVFLSPLLIAELSAEIGGLIVDPDERRCGIGQLLVRQAEIWAREKGCDRIQLRSNIVRQEAHQFYGKMGYYAIKTSLTFSKIL